MHEQVCERLVAGICGGRFFLFRRRYDAGLHFKNDDKNGLQHVFEKFPSLYNKAIASMIGEEVAPRGNVANAFSFDAALGVFLLSTAAIASFSAMSAKGRVFFRWSYIMLALYCYFAENVQNFRA